MPSRNEISATIGSALAPTCSQVYHTSFQRIAMRMGERVTRARPLVSPMKAIWCARRADDQCVRPISATQRAAARHVRGGRRAQRDRIELVESVLNSGLSPMTATPRFRDAVDAQIDQHRDAAAIAIFDPRRFDQHRHRRCRIERCTRIRPDAESD